MEVLKRKKIPRKRQGIPITGKRLLTKLYIIDVLLTRKNEYKKRTHPSDNSEEV